MEGPKETKRAGGADEVAQSLGQFAGWLRNPPEGPVLPPFQASWVEKDTGFALNAREQAAIIADIEKSPTRVLTWIALAAVLVMALGMGVLFAPRLRESVSGPVARAGEPIRAMAMLVQGEVTVLVPGAPEPKSLTSGTVLVEGSRIETGKGGRADLAFSRGSIVRVNANSQLVVQNLRKLEGAENVGLHLEQGSVFNLVERLNQKSEYVVTTPTAIAGVRGTAFQVTTDGEKTEVICHEGSLSVQKTREGSTRVIESHEAVQIGREGVGQVESRPGGEDVARETAALREALKSFDPEVVKATLELVEVKSEADIERIYQRDLETIILKDGRRYRGIVASQMGEQLIIQTVSGQLVVPLDEVKEIYQNQ